MYKFSAITLKNTVKAWIFSGIPILFAAGFLMHNIYKWSGNATIAGIFAPVNESVWEHLKLTFWPMLIWWLSGYFILYKKNKISASQWFASCAAAQLVCPLAIICFHYAYTGALGIEALALDIFSLFISITAAQSTAFHIYKYSGRNRLNISIAILIILAAIFTVCTFTPPHIPLFKDSETGKYGIQI